MANEPLPEQEQDKQNQGSTTPPPPSDSSTSSKKRGHSRSFSVRGAPSPPSKRRAISPLSDDDDSASPGPFSPPPPSQKVESSTAAGTQMDPIPNTDKDDVLNDDDDDDDDDDDYDLELRRIIKGSIVDSISPSRNSRSRSPSPNGAPATKQKQRGSKTPPSRSSPPTANTKMLAASPIPKSVGSSKKRSKLSPPVSSPPLSKSPDSPMDWVSGVDYDEKGGRSSSPVMSPEAKGKGKGDDKEEGRSSSDDPNSSLEEDSSEAARNKMLKAKVYRLKDLQWDDLGTGFCSGVLSTSLPGGPLSGNSQLWSASPPPSPPREPCYDGRDASGSYIVVHREEDDSDIILQSRVEPYNNPTKGGSEDAKRVFDDDDEKEKEIRYTRQQDTLILWNDPDTLNDMALSFASAEGCQEIWNFLSYVHDQIIEVDDDNDDYLSSNSTPPGPGSLQMTMGNGQASLPPDPELNNLKECEEILLKGARSFIYKDRVSTYIVESNFIPKLFLVFDEAEDLESIEDLHQLCVLMHVILLYNENNIYEFCCRDENIMCVLGILEYDPEFSGMKATYREYLHDPSHFRQVVPIHDRSIQSKIHQTYRLRFLKDVVLNRTLDDAGQSIITSLLFFNQMDIVQHLSSDQEFLEELFNIFPKGPEPRTFSSPTRPPNMDDTKMEGMDDSGSPNEHTAQDRHSKGLEEQDKQQERRFDGILFLQQFCAMAKDLQALPRINFYRSMARHGIFRVMEYTLHETFNSPHGDRMRAAGLEILINVIEHIPHDVRHYCYEQRFNKSDSGRRSLLPQFIEFFKAQSDWGETLQLAEALKTLIGTEGMEGLQPLPPPIRSKYEDPEAERFLEYFYQECVDSIVKPITDLTDSPELVHSLAAEQVSGLGILCDLLCFFIANHAHRIKYLLLSSNPKILVAVAALLRTEHKHLKLSALRVFRAIMAKADDFYHRNLMKGNYFAPILDLFASESSHQNLIKSACLEFFTYIRMTNPKSVINHLMERHRDQIKGFAEKHSAFAALQQRWEQNKDHAELAAREAEREKQNPRKPRLGSMSGVWGGGLDRDEESYFNNDDDDDDDAVNALAPFSLEKRVATTRTKRPNPATQTATASRKRLRLSIPSTSALIPGLIPSNSLSGSTGQLRRGLVDYDDDDDDMQEPGGFLRGSEARALFGKGEVLSSSKQQDSQDQTTVTTTVEPDTAPPEDDPEPLPLEFLPKPGEKRRQQEEEEEAEDFTFKKRQPQSVATKSTSVPAEPTTSVPPSPSTGKMQINFGRKTPTRLPSKETPKKISLNFGKQSKPSSDMSISPETDKSDTPITNKDEDSNSQAPEVDKNSMTEQEKG